MNRPPAFQFYPEKWISHTLRLSANAYRIYHKIICWMWSESPNQYSIPNDPAFISMAINIPIDEVETGLKEIQFIGLELLKEDGEKLLSFGLKKERKRQQDWRKKCSAGGVTSGKRRRDKGIRPEGYLKGSSKGSVDLLEVKGNTPTPTPIPTPSPIKEEEGDPNFLPFDGPGKKHDKPDGTVLDKIMVIACSKLIIREPANTRQHFSNAVSVKKWLTWAQLMDAVTAAPKDAYPSDVLKPFVKDDRKGNDNPVNAASPPKTADELATAAQRNMDLIAQQTREAQERREAAAKPKTDKKANELLANLKGAK